MLSKGLHRSQASIFNKLEFEPHTRGEASPLLQMLPAGARTSFPPNTPFLGGYIWPAPTKPDMGKNTNHRGWSGWKAR